MVYGRTLIYSSELWASQHPAAMAKLHCEHGVGNTQRFGYTCEGDTRRDVRKLTLNAGGGCP